jgi:hypothetical protein
MKCLKKKVEERYPQAGSLKEDLLRFFPGFGQHPIEELPETPAG